MLLDSFEKILFGLGLSLETFQFRFSGCLNRLFRPLVVMINDESQAKGWNNGTEQDCQDDRRVQFR